MITIERFALLLALSISSDAQGAPGVAGQVLVEAGKFTEIYDPSTGEKDRWSINDHTFVYGPDAQWHVFGITHPIPLDWYEDPGKNLLHATAQSLTQSPWHKEPFAVTANWDKYGEFLLWAPHVIRHDGTYFMFVCAGNDHGHQYKIHLLTSADLRAWERSPENPLVTDGFDGRDPNVMRLGQSWVMYYTATSSPEGGNHVVAAVTSRDLRHWSGKKVVFTHSKEGTFGGPTESPFVVRRGSSFYLFACDGGTINVYVSDDPFRWEMKNQAGIIYAHASEIVRDQDGA